ncbi:uncharacterized protein PAE49_005985 [Odontesthes bonariensis]|uniref:uncharacterized protein LOC142380646 n=1 Tax=Odontesthes bonariensis TaxID=219752 RepID=UPI003F58E6F2
MDAFLFRGVSQVQYLHCSLSIGLDVSHITKSCSYNKAFGRWEELAASSSVCSCCNSVCADTEGSFENRVRSVGWLVGQKEKAKPRMADMSFQAEEERKLDQEEKGKERMDVHYKDIWTKIDSEEEMGGALTDKKQWKVATGSRQRTSEKQGSESEEVLEEAASQLKDQPPDNIMSDESRRRKKESAQANDKVPYFRNDFVTVLSSDDGKDGSSTTAALRNSPFSLEYNATGDHSKAVNPIIPICPTSANISCSSNNGTVHQERGSDSGHGLVYSAVGVENFSPQNDTIPSGVRDKGKRNATNNSETDIRISPQVRMLGKGGIGPNTFDSILLLEQIKCVHKTVNPMSHTIPVGAANSANSEGSDGDGNLQSRGLESDQSAHSAGLTDLICEVGESDFDTGKEGGFLHLNRFAGEVKGQPEIAGGIPPRHSVGSLSVPSEQVKPSHSAVVTVTNTLHDSESNQMTDKLWPEVLPEWGLRSLGFVVKQPTEVEQELGRRLFFSRLDRLSPK